MARETPDRFIKSDFVACNALAQSLSKRIYPRYKLLLTLRLAHRLYPPLFTICRTAPYKVNGHIYIGRSYPLSSEKDLIRVVKACNESPDKALEQLALEYWQRLQNAPDIPGAIPVIDEARFDAYLIETVLPEIECEVCGLPPGPAPSQLRPFYPFQGYSNLSDDLRVIVLYLHYLIGRQYRAGLYKLVSTLDWIYLWRVLNLPPMARADADIVETAQRLDAALQGPVREFVLHTLSTQPLVAHRVLAHEYEEITGYPTIWSPSDRIQDTLLDHGNRESAGDARENGGEDGLSALCLSGGGIRSASFCLGAIQTLAAHGLFGQFHYLSTVSGGGYIGTAITRWMYAKRNDDDMSAKRALEFAERELGQLRRTDYVADRMTGTSFEQEGPLTWLRMNSNYLARRLSLFSADAWTIVATYLRNLLIVWFTFWPWISAFLFLPWLAVWLGHVPASPSTRFGTVAFGIAGSMIGVLGATYFFQGIPRCMNDKYANFIPRPKGGDKRAALGAVMLVAASFLISYEMWSDVDILQEHRDIPRLLFDYQYVICALAATQLVLALGNTDWFGRHPWKSFVTMIGAALLAAAVQAALIMSIRYGLNLYQPTGWQSGKPPLFNLATIVRALATPALILLGLLIGETIKAAVRSFAEKADRREHQGRAHAFIFMMLTAWLASATIVIGVPLLLDSLGGSVPGATAAGSAVSLAVSTWLGYRKSSPGKPGAQSPVSLTLVGSAGMLLLAVLVSIGAWKAIEHVAMKDNSAHPLRCECANLTTEQRQPDLPSINGFFVPRDERICGIPSAQCVGRGFKSYIDEFTGHLYADLLRRTLGVLAITSLLFYFFGWIIRMNEFSLHGFYRDRLIRAFYGGFRAWKVPRLPALFTGFDSRDDVRLSDLGRLYDDCRSKFDGAGYPAKPPFLVVNSALNLVKGTELAWQERKADSFTFTSLFAGNYRLGYRCVNRFANGVKLGTAMAISGAAFNPNMGYNSSTPMAFLMSVFNVRLGWWLGNPKFSKWERRDPRDSSWILLQEAMGQTTDTNDWIHLSDGGHFDNLGLWEMVHRRCRRILVIDASQDGRFSMEDLYTAIRKIRIDMGIEIVADEAPVLLFPRSARASGLCHARFTIRYTRDNGQDAAGRNGVLLYLKPCVYGTEPPDIQEYALKHQDFPHEPTADQFFNESQFESYRKLGEWEMLQLLRYALQKCDVNDIPAEVPMNTDAGNGNRGLFS